MDSFDKAMLTVFALLIAPLILGALALVVLAVNDPTCITR